MSIAKVIESIEREIFERAEKEENAEMVDTTNLEDDSDNRQYIKGCGDAENE